MNVLRWLLGTIGVLLGIVLLILGVVLSPVLLLLAPLGILVYLAWKFWWLRRKAARGIERQRKEVGKKARKIKKGVQKHV
jgi:hypothetical protein